MNSSRNNNDDDLLTGAFNVMSNYINKKMQNSLPVKVTKVSADRKFVDVQPQILVIDSKGGTTLRGEIKGIPVITSGAGDFLISFNIAIGDLGWIEASDRDISLFKQSYSQSKPNTRRLHDFSDARFVPDIMTDFTIDAEDADSMTIQNRDSSVKISLNNNRIKLKAPDIFIDAANNIDFICGGQFIVAATAGADINGVTIDAAGTTFSPVSFTAPNIVGTVNVTFGGISGVNHSHPYTWTDGAGSGSTGAPV